MVNTASECGYTPQYAGLQKLHSRFAEKGFSVLGFPSNDFGGQEPGTDAQIRYFCQSNYKVEFPMFSKGPVSGAKTQPVYSWLLENSAVKGPVEWNFEKFLVGRDGKVVGRFKSGTTPDDAKLIAAIEKALAVKKGS